MTEPSDIRARTYLVLFQPEPDALQHSYQTIREPFGYDLDAFKAKALELVASIETAAREERLALQERQNVITGARGLIIAEAWQAQHPQVANVIAELLAEWPHELNDTAKNPFGRLCWSALHQELSVVVHANGPGGSRVAFASLVRDAKDSLTFEYLARLLLTESEISQWNVTVNDRSGSSRDPSEQPPGFSSSNAAIEIDCTQLTICGSCCQILGPWSKLSNVDTVMYQRCAEPEGYAPWPEGFDFQTVAEPCNCCGLEVLRTGSRWSIWFCDSCKERVREIHGRYRAYLLPIGRHSAMAGFGLSGRAAREPTKVSAFIGKARTMGNSIQHLSKWARHVVERNSKVLGLGADTSVVSYWNAAVAKFDKGAAFDGLRRHFDLDSGIARIARD